jgi:hypothetical protein
VHDSLTRNRLARLLLAFSGFRLAASVCWIYLAVKTGLEAASPVSTTTLLTLLFSSLLPLASAFLLMLASIGVRRGSAWGRHVALGSAVLDIAFFIFVSTTYALGRAWELVLALQAVAIWYRFSLRWFYDEAAAESE